MRQEPEHYFSRCGAWRKMRKAHGQRRNNVPRHNVRFVWTARIVNLLKAVPQLPLAIAVVPQILRLRCDWKHTAVLQRERNSDPGIA